MYHSSSGFGDETPRMVANFTEDGRLYLRLYKTDSDVTFLMSHDEAIQLTRVLTEALVEHESQACVDCGTRDSVAWWTTQSGQRICSDHADLSCTREAVS